MTNKMVKNICSLTFSVGVGTIIDGVAKAVCPQMNLVQRACVKATTIMAALLVEEKLTEYTCLKIDEITTYVKEKANNGETSTSDVRK